jgi:hypothetical protein
MVPAAMARLPGAAQPALGARWPRPPSALAGPARPRCSPPARSARPWWLAVARGPASPHPGARRRSPRLGAQPWRPRCPCPARLPLPRVSAGRPWRARARPSLAALAQPGVAPARRCAAVEPLPRAPACALRRSARRGRARPCPVRSCSLRLGAAWPWRGHGARSRCGLGGARGASARPVQRAVPPASSPHPRLAVVSLGPGVCAARSRHVSAALRARARVVHGALARLAVPLTRLSTP